MPDRFLYILFVLPLLPSLAFADGPVYVSPGHSGLKGKAVSYMELVGASGISTRRISHMPCYYSTRKDISFLQPNMFCYTRLDEKGNMLWQQWYGFTSVTERERRPNPVAGMLALASRHEERKTSEYYYFYEDQARKRLAAVIITNNEGEFKDYVTFIYNEKGQVAQTVYYDVEYRPIFRNTWQHDGLRLISSNRESDGRIDSGQLFWYRGESTRILKTAMTDHEGQAISSIEYDRHNRPRKMTVHKDGTNRKGSYSYKYKYAAGGTAKDYSYLMVMYRGQHPYFVLGEYTNENGLMTYMRTISVQPGDEDGRKRKKSDYTGQESEVRYRFIYNKHRDYTHTTDLTGNGHSSELLYFYDDKGNWYVKTTWFPEISSVEPVTTLRSIRYTDK